MAGKEGGDAMPPPAMPPPSRKEPPAPQTTADENKVSNGGDAAEALSNKAGAGEAGKAMPPPSMLPPSSKQAMPPPAGKAQGPEAGGAVGGGAGPEPAGYEKPSWAGAPDGEKFPYYFEILKNGTIIDKVDLVGKDHILIGRNADTCAIAMEHPSISRQHAAVQFKADGSAYIYDMSTHGTRVNKRQLKSRVYARLRVGDVLALGSSTRLLIFSGPDDLIEPVEGGWGFKKREEPAPAPALKSASAKMAPKKVDKVSLGNRDVSWGFGDDAEEVDSGDEVSDAVGEARQMKEAGKLSEKQDKLLEKIEKKLQKIAHLRDEAKRIKAKEDAGVELSQGQQNQIEKCEKHIKDIEVSILPQEEALAEMLRPTGKKPEDKDQKKGGGGERRRRQRRGRLLL